MNRRQMLQAAGISAAAPIAAGLTSASAETPKKAGSVDMSTPQRKMAAKRLTGLLNLLLPTFMPDGKTLDEDAIRHDVRASIAQGFTGTMPLINWTSPADPNWEKLHRIIKDEAGDKLALHGVIAATRVEDDLALIKRLEDVGAEMILFASRFSSNISNDELYGEYKKRLEATDLSFILYCALNKGRNFPQLGPAGQPLEVFDRVADHGNVVAAKISQPVTLTSTVQICDAVADRLLVAPVNLDYVPLLARHYHMQWSGQWNGEAVQTPANQLGNQLLNACAEKDFKTADKVATQLQPSLDHFFKVQANSIRLGGHPWQHNRYYAWLSGGNGGLMPVDPHSPPESIPVLTAADRAAMRAAYQASGLTPTDAPEEQFIVGRAAWARGVRPADLAELPRYES